MNVPNAPTRLPGPPAPTRWMIEPLVLPGSYDTEELPDGRTKVVLNLFSPDPSHRFHDLDTGSIYIVSQPIPIAVPVIVDQFSFDIDDQVRRWADLDPLAELIVVAGGDHIAVLDEKLFGLAGSMGSWQGPPFAMMLATAVPL